MKSNNIPHDQVLLIGVPVDHELIKARDKKESETCLPAGQFRSKATATLEKDEFANICWPLRESRSENGLEIKVAVKTEHIPAFREKMERIGLSCLE